MPEQVKKILAKIVEIWNKYTKKQRTIFLSIIGTVILAFAILTFIMSRITYVDVYTFENKESVAEAVTVLKDAAITYRVAEDGLTIQVDETMEMDAVFKLTSSTLGEDKEFTLNMLLSNDLSTTNSDRKLKVDLYMAAEIEKNLEGQTGVEKARVSYYPTSNNTSILASAQDISCSVFLTINEEFNIANAESLAYVVAYSLGNKSVDSIKIMDQNSNLLFGGVKDDEEEYNINERSILSYKKLVESYYVDKLFLLAVKNGYTDAQITCDFDVNTDVTSVLFREYIAGENLEQGLMSTYNKITSEGTSGSGDVVGTDANDEDDYYITNNSSGQSSYEEIDITYVPSEKTTETLAGWGVINNGTSSLSIVLTNVKDIYETDLKLLGVLEDTTFEEYVAANSERKRIEFSDDYYDLFAMGSGIPRENISIMAYEVPNYIPEEVEEFDWQLIMQIALAVLIIGLLVFVVFRSLEPEEIVELEPELSVEQLLATTRENQTLEDIELAEKSETRRTIEKFIDENPEAVAALLRNWLNEEWN